jgi:hypothetical protein
MSTFNFTLVVNSPASTSVTFTPATGPFVAPLAAGTVVGSVAVLPTTWSGVISVSAPFSMAGNNVVVGSTALAAGSYNGTGSATP